jgi:predicted phosphodiesterase
MSAHHPIIVAGDPHGDHKPIIRACLESEPGTLILLGDLDLVAPLKVTYAAVLKAHWRLRYIHGNHDADSELFHDSLLEDAPGWNIHGGFVEAGGLLIGGLGGIFKGSVWYPREGDEEGRWATRADFMRQCRHQDRWRKGLPFRQRDTIFPEDIERLGKLRLDVLVTHEAPLPHKHGFAALNALARTCGARLLVHGHHHRSYEAETILPSGRTLHIRGLAKAEPWVLEMPG